MNYSSCGAEFYVEAKTLKVTLSGRDYVSDEDGNIYEFTPNHKLLVSRNGVEEYIPCLELVEGDEIVEIKKSN